MVGEVFVAGIVSWKPASPSFQNHPIRNRPNFECRGSQPWLQCYTSGQGQVFKCNFQPKETMCRAGKDEWLIPQLSTRSLEHVVLDFGWCQNFSNPNAKVAGRSSTALNQSNSAQLLASKPVSEFKKKGHGFP